MNRNQNKRKNIKKSNAKDIFVNKFAMLSIVVHVIGWRQMMKQQMTFSLRKQLKSHRA